MYEKDENIVKSDKVESLSIDDKFETSSNKSEYSKKSKNGQLNKYSVSKLTFQYSKRIKTLILILLKINVFMYILVNKNKVLDQFYNLAIFHWKNSVVVKSFCKFLFTFLIRNLVFFKV